MPRLTSVPLLLAALLLAPLLLGAAACTPDRDAAFGQRVRAYLLEHPEVLEEAIRKLDQNRAVQAAASQTRALAGARSALERDPRDFVLGDPAAPITVVEFFDYRCGYCKAIAPEVLDLVQGEGDVRLVFKEFPILPDAGGGGIGVSERASRAAIAAKAKGAYLPVHRDLMAARGLDDAAIARIAQRHGLDARSLAARGGADAVDRQLADTHQLAQTLGVAGTPTFVVGDVVVPSADLDALKAAIAQARAKLRRPA